MNKSQEFKKYYPYNVTLTLSERKALDAVEHSYCTGSIKGILLSCAQYEDNTFDTDLWYDENIEVTFYLPNYAAFAIIGLCKLEDFLYPLWSKELAQKFNNLTIDVIGFMP